MPDPGAASALYTQFIAPFPEPGGGQEIIFGSGGKLLYQSSYQSNALTAPTVVLDGGSAIYLETMVASSYQQGAANTLAWVASGNGIYLQAITQLDGGPWTPLDVTALPTPLTMGMAYDQGTGTPWLAAGTYNMTHLFLAPMDGTSTTYQPRNPDSGALFPAAWVAATSCSIPDGGSAICFAFTSGTTQQNELWGGVFVPATQLTQTTLFEVAPTTDPQFTGVAIANLGNGQLACVGSAQSATAIKYSWAAYSSIDTAPSMNTVTVTSANGDPGLFAWHGAPVLFYVDQSGFPYVQKAMALSGPAVGDFPSDAGITKYPLGYTDDNGALYIGLQSTPLAEVQLFKLP